MLMSAAPPSFAPINAAFRDVFTPGRLSIGLVVPIEAHPDSPVPTLTRHVERVQLAERLGFRAVWLRDVPFNVPSFGDAGQTHDPFVYLGLLAGKTERIALGVASLILPLRHPAHVAKAAASVDQLSAGRLLLGVASGDRPEEYPAMALSHAERGERFRASFDYIRAAADAFPRFDNAYGAPDGRLDLLPKPTGPRLPLLVTGGSRQPPDWVAENADGWITYPRGVAQQAETVRDWRARTAEHGGAEKPVTQSLYIDLDPDPDAPPQPIHLGFRSGWKPLRDYLKALEEIGVNHVALNLRFNRADVEATLDDLARDVLPAFTA